MLLAIAINRMVRRWCARREAVLLLIASLSHLLLPELCPTIFSDAKKSFNLWNDALLCNIPNWWHGLLFHTVFFDVRKYPMRWYHLSIAIVAMG
jgi:hypothetical protein